MTTTTAAYKIKSTNGVLSPAISLATSLLSCGRRSRRSFAFLRGPLPDHRRSLLGLMQQLAEEDLAFGIKGHQRKTKVVQRGDDDLHYLRHGSDSSPLQVLRDLLPPFLRRGPDGGDHRLSSQRPRQDVPRVTRSLSPPTRRTRNS